MKRMPKTFIHFQQEKLFIHVESLAVIYYIIKINNGITYTTRLGARKMDTLLIILFFVAAIASVACLLLALVSLVQKKEKVKTYLTYAGISFLLFLLSLLGMGML